MRVKSKHLIAVLIIIIISVIGIPKFVFPHLVSENLQAALEKKFGGDIFVEVNTKFGWELIAGIFSSIRIVGKDLIFDALTIAEIDLECSNLRINLKKLIQDQEFEYYSCERLLTKLILAESHLNQYYWAKIDPNKYFKINISKEGASLNGEFHFLDTNWNLDFVGEFNTEGQATVIFNPKELIILDTRVPKILLELISEHYVLAIDLSGLPLPVKIDQIELADEKIILLGSGVVL
ncbi:MAG: DUF2993 domain-containing protein [Firmicutes bacterium]|nr:DUF2993 domain-containing protein [Bacillota bacterium]